MGGGGGDDGYEARQAAVEERKAAARQLLNARFGEGAPSAVDRSRFTTQRWVDDESGQPTAPVTFLQYGDDSGVTSARSAPALRYESVFDQAGYDAAQAENDAIGGTKAAREALYGTVRNNAFNAGKRGLDESRDRAQRDLRFELFAKGLNGGSEDINQNAMLGRTYDAGILDLGAKADAAATGLRNSDEQARLSLLQGIDSGMDQGSVLSSAANQLANNASAASAEAQGTSIGDLFANAGLLSQQSQYRAGKQAGFDAYGSLFGNNNTPTTSVLGSKATAGRITPS